ncbi:MAG: ABC transporter permease [Acetivibrionales bacterium]|jgi:ribose transport system permease protein
MINIKTIYNNKIAVAFLIAIILFIIGQIISPGFAEMSHIMNILSLSSFLGVIALAQTIVIISGSEGIDLSIGSIISLGAVMASQIMNGDNADMARAILIVCIVGAAIGIINGIGISYFRIPPLVMTLAMSSVVQGISLIYTKGQPKGRASQILEYIGTGRVAGIPGILIVWVIVIILALIILTRTPWGNLLYGVGSNSLTAELSGVRTRVLRTVAYVLSGAISALCGVFLLGYTGTSYLDIGSDYVMPSVAAVVIGGVSLAGGFGSYMGTVAGAIVLTTLGSILVTLKMGEAGRQIVYGTVLMALLIVYARQKKN